MTSAPSSTGRARSLSTGAPTLDEMLDGGFPAGRAILVTGTPGTGKSTLSMQFLQAGLERGEECLFVSTEQTLDELHDAFAPFDFDLDHENLTITSIHARTGRTFESTDAELVIERFGEGDVIGEGFSAPFTSDRIQQVLDRHFPADRVVVDSVTGLEPMAEDRDTYRRGVLDLIQYFTDEHDATTVFTSEYVGQSARSQAVETVASENTVQYNVYGVLRLWRERKRGDVRRFVDVMKMRGVDHDTRPHELTFSEAGVDVAPRRRALPESEAGRERFSTGLDRLDEILGGGLPKGDTALLEHDGQANIVTLLFTTAANALERGMSIVLVPQVNTSPDRIDDLVQRASLSVDGTRELLDEDRLFVVDALGAWESHDNVFNPRREDAGLQYLFEQIRERSAGSGLFMLLNTEAKVHGLGAEQIRRFRYWLPSQFITEDDVLLDVHNPRVMEDGMAEFYTDATSLGIETWLDDTGLQYLRLKKGEVAEVGQVALVEYLDSYPYIELR